MATECNAIVTLDPEFTQDASAEHKAEGSRGRSKTRPLKSMWQFTPGAERPPVRCVPEAVKQLLEMKGRVCFSKLDSSTTACRIAQTGSHWRKNSMDKVGFSIRLFMRHDILQ